MYKMFVVYAKSKCPFCKKAIAALEGRKIQHKVNFISDTVATIAMLRANGSLPQNSVHKTVPIVFGSHGEFTGGCDALLRSLM